MRKTNKSTVYETADLGGSVRHDRLSGDGPILRRSLVLAERRDPDDVDANRREPRRIVGAMAACPLREMHRRSGLVTEQHLAAVERLRDVYERGVCGATDAARSALVPGGYGAGSYAPEAQLVALTTYRLAFRAMGKMGGAVVAFVALNYPPADRSDVSAWAARVGMPPLMARGVLIGALDALVTHFSPPGRSVVDDMVDDFRRAAAVGK